MTVKRYSWYCDYINGKIDKVGMKQVKDGGYVSYDDYKHLSDYCDHLVEFSKLPCLPKDLDNLRQANTNFACENESLKKELELYKRQHKEYAKTFQIFQCGGIWSNRISLGSDIVADGGKYLINRVQHLEREVDRLNHKLKTIKNISND